MNHFAMVLVLLLGACAVIMLKALNLAEHFAFFGGLIVVAIAGWLVDKG